MLEEISDNDHENHTVASDKCLEHIPATDVIAVICTSMEV